MIVTKIVWPERHVCQVWIIGFAIFLIHRPKQWLRYCKSAALLRSLRTALSMSPFLRLQMKDCSTGVTPGYITETLGNLTQLNQCSLQCLLYRISKQLRGKNNTWGRLYTSHQGLGSPNGGKNTMVREKDPQGREKTRNGVNKIHDYAIGEGVRTGKLRIQKK